MSQRSVLSKKLTPSQPRFQYPLNQHFKDWHSTSKRYINCPMPGELPHAAQKEQDNSRDCGLKLT